MNNLSPASDVSEAVAEQVTFNLNIQVISIANSRMSIVYSNTNHAIPGDLDFDQVEGLSNEIRQKLNEMRPANLARAGRIRV